MRVSTILLVAISLVGCCVAAVSAGPSATNPGKALGHCKAKGVGHTNGKHSWDEQCIQDCEYTTSAWSSCSVTCGVGSRTRKNTITEQAANGGLACPNVVEIEVCNTGVPCPVDCEYTVNAWSTCSATCGAGTMTQTTTITRPAAFGGAACPAVLEETKTCESGVACAVNCDFTVSDWSICSATCGAGTTTRTTTINTQASNGGTACPTELSETTSCNTGVPCPVNCVVSDWRIATACGVCGGGTSTSTRTITTEAANGGTACPTDLIRTDGECQPESAFNTVVNIYSPAYGVYLTRAGSTIGHSWAKSDAMAVRFEAKCDNIEAPFMLYTDDGLALIKSSTPDPRWGCGAFGDGACYFLLEFSDRETTQYWDIHRTWVSNALSYAQGRGITKLSELFGTADRAAVNTGLAIGRTGNDRSSPESSSRGVLTLRTDTAAVAVPWWYSDEVVQILQA